ncbi:MAG: hypothetical protein Harvfovirus3_51 [Harvfovirus sp.]|uniref:Uncharacterized protein n=1 Tax=Harvfovirus sp. TaxID=2487768 RepID=A0A3G5A055_9VIRU|nr:MAG: hypothetical protein Harvfovirus3_51 [Harvfovirus sp.]
MPNKCPEPVVSNNNVAYAERMDKSNCQWIPSNDPATPDLVTFEGTGPGTNSSYDIKTHDELYVIRVDVFIFVEQLVAGIALIMGPISERGGKPVQNIFDNQLIEISLVQHENYVESKDAIWSTKLYPNLTGPLVLRYNINERMSHLTLKQVPLYPE